MDQKYVEASRHLWNEMCAESTQYLEQGIKDATSMVLMHSVKKIACLDAQIAELKICLQTAEQE